MGGYWKIAHSRISLHSPLFLGILNVTPDSFSDGGYYTTIDAAISQVLYLVSIGVNLIDIGAESTRPGASVVTPENEWDRLESVIKAIRRELPHIPISLDTRHALVAKRGLAAGVAVINDVSGFQDANMLQVIQDSDCGLIAMRSRIKNKKNIMPPYEQQGQNQPDIAIKELKIIRDRLTKSTIDKERILLDPGFGFGTSFAEDTAIWNALNAIPNILDWPAERFCIGLSRKRFLAWRSGNPSMPPINRDDLTARAHREVINLGYRVFRTHAAMQ
jgi:dihydropteroate synthase